MCSGSDLSLILGTQASLPPSVLLFSLPSRGLSGRSGQSPLTRCQSAKYFDAIYTLKQPYKIHIGVLCTTGYRNQRACTDCTVQPLSAYGLQA